MEVEVFNKDTVNGIIDVIIQLAIVVIYFGGGMLLVSKIYRLHTISHDEKGLAFALWIIGGFVVSIGLYEYNRKYNSRL
jgi:divalent metal cation (Fe/Co/Zn/Cd) transporter